MSKDVNKVTIWEDNILNKIKMIIMRTLKNQVKIHPEKIT